MNKFFKIIGFICLILFSFFYTEKTVNVVKEQDELMIKIKQEQYKYKIDVLESIVDNDTIIPGINGLEVNIDKSYEKIRSIGIYDPNYLVYNQIYPNNKLNDNLDKYIIKGNKNKKMMSLIFLINNDDNIYEIIQILKNNNFKANFFVTSEWFSKNNELISFLINNGYNVGYYGNHDNSEFIWMNTILKTNLKQNNNYCYLEEKNDKYLNICKLNKNYTIIPNVIIKKDLLINVKKNIESGNIIAIDINNSTNEFELTIKYIKSKGLELVNLDKLLDTNNQK